MPASPVSPSIQGFEGVLEPLVRAVFAEDAWFTTVEASRLVAAIAQAEREIAGSEIEPGVRSLAHGLVSELRWPKAGCRFGVGKHVALDFVADAPGCAEDLHARGLHATAFSLEGIAGRLLELLLAT